jgi:hypothetical protein
MLTPIDKEFQCANCGRSTMQLHKDKNNEYTCKRRSIDEIIKSGELRRGQVKDISSK